MERGFHHSTRSDQYIGATVGSAGTAAGAIGPCPEGFCWYVERLTSWSNTANSTTGVLEVYVQVTGAAPSDTSKQGRQDVAVGSIVQNGVSDQRSPIFVGPGDFLVAAWSKLTNGDLVALTAQVRVHKLDAGQPVRPAPHMPGDVPHDPQRLAGHYVLPGDSEPYGPEPDQAQAV